MPPLGWRSGEGAGMSRLGGATRDIVFEVERDCWSFRGSRSELDFCTGVMYSQSIVTELDAFSGAVDMQTETRGRSIHNYR